MERHFFHHHQRQSTRRLELWKSFLIVLTTNLTINAFSPCLSPLRISNIRQKQDFPNPLLSVIANPDVGDLTSVERLEYIYTSIGSSRDTMKINTTADPDVFDWSFIEKAYIITCPKADPNSERLNNAMSILTQVGLNNRVEIKEFETDDEDRIRGCYKSHISVIRDAMDDIRAGEKRKGMNSPEVAELWKHFISFMGEERVVNSKDKEKFVLVLEDNIECNGNLKGLLLESISEFLSSNKKADMFHLSYIPYVPNLVVTKTDNKNVVKLSCGVGSALGTTAYIVNESSMKALSRHDARRGYYAAIPDVMAELFPESRYAAYPTPFLRGPDTKSLVNPQLDDLRSMLFQPTIVAQAQNLLAFTGQSSNNLFFSLVGILILASGSAGKITIDATWQIMKFGQYEGNVIVPVASLIFSLLTLAVLGHGVALAPKPPSQENVDEDEVWALSP